MGQQNFACDELSGCPSNNTIQTCPAAIGESMPGPVIMHSVSKGDQL